MNFWLDLLLNLGVACLIVSAVLFFYNLWDLRDNNLPLIDPAEDLAQSDITDHLED